MGDKSRIEWCDATWNPITGCTPISAGCGHCYAKRMAERFPKAHGESAGCNFMMPHPFSYITFHPDRLDQPLRWKKPRRIFVCSMGDLFHEDVSEDQIDAVINTAARANICGMEHTFMILTKRPKRMKEYLAGLNKFYPNIWLGVTVEDSDHLYRAEYLMQTPAAKRFVSVEPCLSNIDFQGFLRGIDWFIVGGETGPGARECRYEWVLRLRNQCVNAGAPFFFKGWGTAGLMRKNDPHYMKIDGKEWKQFPA